MSSFGTFWSGPALTAFEAACLHSFVVSGHDITLYSFEPIENVPESVRVKDAASIADARLLTGFRVDGKASLSHFSDYFRYLMFQKTSLIWVDTDVFCLSDWTQEPGSNLLALEAPGSICNAVMRIRSDEPCLPLVIEGAEALMGTDMRWGDTGPRLLTRLLGHRSALQLEPPSLYFPIHYDDFWKVFLPSEGAQCEQQCADARTLHLWNNIVDRLGFWKEFLPPQGSYLHRLFVERGCAPFFRGVFPEKNMVQLVENWRSRQSGSHLGIGSVVRQLVPSIRRSYRHHAG